ncbi:hypothetical protein GCM10023222_51400 [Saccharopolyspora cebuensis]
MNPALVYKVRAGAKADMDPVSKLTLASPRSRAIPSRWVTMARPTPLPACCSRGVHRLDLRVVVIELLQRTDGEELAAGAVAPERDRGIQQAVEVQCVDVLGWTVRAGELPVVFQQRAHVGRARVVQRDHGLGHAWRLRSPRFVRITDSRSRDARSCGVGHAA